MEQRRVLIVEDDAVIGQWLHACFEEIDWRVTRTEAGDEALHLLCDEADFDLVLLDVWLPEINGLELLRTLRGFGVNSPVMVMTAYGESFDQQQARRLGAADVLIKPFDISQLIDRVQSVVDC